ncbi:MAG: hypothetical protein WBG32_13550 [Nodosilinea sp.]
MTNEELLIKKWRSFSSDQQRQVLEFIQTLSVETKAEGSEADPKPISELGKRLRKRRAEIIASGVPLLTMEEVNRAERRGVYQEENA